MGDFNCKSPAWYCDVSNPNGNILLDHSILKNFDIHAPTSATYIPTINTNKKSVLDIALTKHLNCHKRIFTLNALNSDHLPVILHLTDLDIVNKKNSSLITDWKAYRDDLTNTLRIFPGADSTSPIDATVDSLTSTLNDAASRNSHPSTHCNDAHTLPKHILTLINERNRARRWYQQTYYPPAYRAYINLKKRVASQIRRFRSRNWDSFTASLEPGGKSFWRLSKTFSKPRSPVAPLLADPDSSTLTYSKIGKAEIIAKHLSAQFHDNSPHDDLDFRLETQRELSRIHTDDFYHRSDDIDHCSPREVHHCILSLNNKNSRGSDNISNQMLKWLPVLGFVLLTNLFNNCLRLRYFPLAWKHAIISPILKAGKNPRLAVNYRPISLLSNLGKVFEHILLRRLKKFQLLHPFLPAFQFGFRPKLSTTHQLARVSEVIIRGFNLNQYTVGVFLDVAKAFDKVWLDGLLIKLNRIHLPNYLLMTVNNFLRDRTFQVRVDDILSCSHPTSAGVPQGSVLAPQLFSAFLYDFSPLPNCTTALYADDTTILSTSTNIAIATQWCQGALKILELYFKKWQIQINPTKSTAILFRPNRKKTSIPVSQLLLNFDTIPWAKSVKYLGIYFDDRLNFKHHIHVKAAKAMSTYFALRPLLNFRSRLSLKAKLMIFKMVIRTALIYGCPIWAHLSEFALQRMQINQNKILRVLCGARWFNPNRLIHKDLAIPTIKNFVTGTSIKFYKSSAKIKNSAFRDVMDYDWNLPRRFPSPRIIIDRDSRPP